MFKNYYVVRKNKFKSVYIKKCGIIQAVYSGGWWEATDKEILQDFLFNNQGDSPNKSQTESV